MEELYGFSSSGATDAPVYSMETNQTGENMLSPAGNYPVVSGFPSGFAEHMFGSTATGQLLSGSSGISDADSMVPEEEVSSAIRAKIASHPLYPKLLQAYIDCQKVGAPPEIVKVLDEISGESSEVCNRSTAFIPPCFGADPELDHFMENYCEMLVKYKSDLSKPFDEATTFLNSIKTQLSHLCNVVSVFTLLYTSLLVIVLFISVF
ncbi:homeobox knotted-1-like protein [Corchorus olitorius]|uniref:Homeobox knotted-1-like protein n=1 Tax=Corchorus olitorius TaxID=93759 RepID=A0A1R3HB67_9ROSI|nr:homeobox knotted-1-like protein [Corchorus olitorius]